MEFRIAVYAVLFVLVVASAKQIIDIDNKKLADEWASWSEWSGSNCTVQGNRAVPLLLDFNASIVIYKCTDGKTWEARPGRAPDGWESS